MSKIQFKFARNPFSKLASGKGSIVLLVALLFFVVAGTGNVLRDVMQRGIMLLGLGLCIGMAATLIAARALDGFLFEVSPTDPLTLGAVTLLLSIASMAASFIPARRATKVDPASALRHD